MGGWSLLNMVMSSSTWEISAATPCFFGMLNVFGMFLLFAVLLNGNSAFKSPKQAVWNKKKKANNCDFDGFLKTECLLDVPSEKIDVSMIRSDLVCSSNIVDLCGPWSDRWDLGGFSPKAPWLMGFIHTHTWWLVPWLWRSSQFID